MKDNVTGKDKEFVQEPLEYWTVEEGWVKIDEVPVYTAPPQRPWVGLTVQEAADCWTTSASKTWHNFEAKLKDKNT